MYTSLRISRFWEATFLTTWAKYSDTLRFFDELWYDELEDVIEQSLVGTDRYESLHCIEFFPVAVRVELLPDIEKLGLVICIEVGNAAADNSQVPCML